MALTPHDPGTALGAALRSVPRAGRLFCRLRQACFWKRAEYVFTEEK